jgi:hypothetical protein
MKDSMPEIDRYGSNDSMAESVDGRPVKDDSDDALLLVASPAP